MWEHHVGRYIPCLRKNESVAVNYMRMRVLKIIWGWESSKLYWEINNCFPSNFDSKLIMTFQWNITISNVCSCLWSGWLRNSTDFGWAGLGGSSGLSWTISDVQGDELMDGGQLAFSCYRMSLAEITGLIQFCPKCLITQQASTEIPMVTKKLRMRISLMLSSLWLCHASQQLIGHSKFYDEPLPTLLSYRADRHWHYFSVKMPSPARILPRTPIVISESLKPWLLRGDS